MEEHVGTKPETGPMKERNVVDRVTLGPAEMAYTAVCCCLRPSGNCGRTGLLCICSVCSVLRHLAECLQEENGQKVQ